MKKESLYFIFRSAICILFIWKFVYHIYEIDFYIKQAVDEIFTINKTVKIPLLSMVMFIYSIYICFDAIIFNYAKMLLVY